MDDWATATSHMPRVMWAVLFQVCVYNWRKTAPVPRGKLRIMVADLEKAGENIVQALLDDGALVEDTRGVYSERALAEAEKALDLWERKSRGGRASKPAPKEESSKTLRADSDSDLDSEKKEDSCPSDTRGLVVDAWNEMAGQNDLAQVRQMTDARTKSLKARIKEHGAETLVEHIARIPQYPFLLGKSETGWKANFDWLLQPSSCTKLIEGAYARGKGKGSAWTA
jgi:hypothetical protein